MKKYYAIQQAENQADVYIFGDIVSEQWLPEETSGYSLVQQLKNIQADTINVYIDSYGGSVSEGWAIYNTLRHHPAKINTYGDGFVASAALYPFLAGDNRIASSLSAYFLHQVMTGADGYPDDLRAAAKEAELMTDVGIGAFVERAGMEREQVLELMKSETWLTPQQALDYGIATAIVADESPKCRQAAKEKIFRQLCQKAKKEPEPHKNKIMNLFKER